MDKVNSIDPELRTLLRGARHIAVLTGAGISAESGLPTFRQAQTGLWARYRPEDLATMRAFVRDPVLVWDWYAWRRQLAREAEPNAGHLALARLQALVPRLDLVTQNVDGFARSGRRGADGLGGSGLAGRGPLDSVLKNRFAAAGGADAQIGLLKQSLG